jgi:tetratricopeptide (TPR) repeat protein
MSKLLLFGLLFWLIGNPIVAIIVLILILYVLDRRFVGLSPSIVKPLKRRSRIKKLEQLLRLNPSDVSSKMELARLQLERKSYARARQMLESVGDAMEHSAEYWDDLGTALLFTGDKERGEQAMLRALAINPRVKYGEPYLRLAAANRSDAEKALSYLKELRDIHSSSCEAYYRMGLIYKELGNKTEAKRAFQEAAEIYASLPRYKRRQERSWALRSWAAKLAMN